jgi:hypothetical protein
MAKKKIHHWDPAILSVVSFIVGTVCLAASFGWNVYMMINLLFKDLSFSDKWNWLVATHSIQWIFGLFFIYMAVLLLAASKCKNLNTKIFEMASMVEPLLKWSQEGPIYFNGRGILQGRSSALSLFFLGSWVLPQSIYLTLSFYCILFHTPWSVFYWVLFSTNVYFSTLYICVSISAIAGYIFIFPVISESEQTKQKSNSSNVQSESGLRPSTYLYSLDFLDSDINNTRRRIGSTNESASNTDTIKFPTWLQQTYILKDTLSFGKNNSFYSTYFFGLGTIWTGLFVTTYPWLFLLSMLVYKYWGSMNDALDDFHSLVLIFYSVIFLIVFGGFQFMTVAYTRQVFLKHKEAEYKASVNWNWTGMGFSVLQLLLLGCLSVGYYYLDSEWRDSIPFIGRELSSFFFLGCLLFHLTNVCFGWNGLQQQLIPYIHIYNRWKDKKKEYKVDISNYKKDDTQMVTISSGTSENTTDSTDTVQPNRSKRLR